MAKGNRFIEIETRLALSLAELRVVAHESASINQAFSTAVRQQIFNVEQALQEWRDTYRRFLVKPASSIR